MGGEGRRRRGRRGEEKKPLREAGGAGGAAANGRRREGTALLPPAGGEERRKRRKGGRKEGAAATAPTAAAAGRGGGAPGRASPSRRAGRGGLRGRDVSGAAQVLPAGAEQDGVGGARALPEPLPGRLRGLRLRLVSAEVGDKGADTPPSREGSSPTPGFPPPPFFCFFSPPPSV